MKKIFQAFFILTFLSKCIYAQQSFPKNGVDENFKPIYAFTNANIIISPNLELKKSMAEVVSKIRGIDIVDLTKIFLIMLVIRAFSELIK